MGKKQKGSASGQEAKETRTVNRSTGSTIQVTRMSRPLEIGRTFLLFDRPDLVLRSSQTFLLYLLKAKYPSVSQILGDTDTKSERSVGTTQYSAPVAERKDVLELKAPWRVDDIRVPRHPFVVSAAEVARGADGTCGRMKMWRRRRQHGRRRQVVFIDCRCSMPHHVLSKSLSNGKFQPTNRALVPFRLH
ncbi:Uncharacterized protein Fot_14006 [Forsythia ovata]|uniref:Uncharacterized protein n=1 Tax=Forsythia ovata TaxID=205694 RepID=A0ABD1W7L5_9LAMI